MKIVVIEVCIEDIKTGDCFKFYDDFWIKSCLSKKEGETEYFECVELKAGNQRMFKQGDKVEKVQAIFQIHA